MKSLSPSLFPSVGYMAVWLSGGYSWNVSAKYEKRSLRNRYRIAGPNGAQDLSAQIDHSSDKSAFSKVQLDHEHSWIEKEWRSIETAYRNASFFEALEWELKEIILTPHVLLLDRCEASMTWMLSQLNEDSSLAYSTERDENPQIVSPGWKYEALSYRQVFKLKNGFIPYLSALDLLMNEGPVACDILNQQAQILKKSHP